MLALVVVLNILENKKPASTAKKQPHFVSASCRAQHPGNKKPANTAEKNSPILLALVVVLNILENKKPANTAINSPIMLALVVVLNILETRSQQTMQKKQPHFVSASCRAQHPGNQGVSP